MNTDCKILAEEVIYFDVRSLLKCKDVADTKKLLNGETVMVEWDNSGYTS